MPLYLFQNEKTGETREVYFGMNDVKNYTGEPGEKGKWKRVWTKPNAGVDTKVDPYSAKDFIKATNKPGTYGDLQDRSAELSQKRADKNGGRDPIREQYYEDYAKTRHGLEHPDVSKRKANEKLKKLGVHID